MVQFLDPPTALRERINAAVHNLAMQVEGVPLLRENDVPIWSVVSIESGPTEDVQRGVQIYAYRDADGRDRICFIPQVVVDLRDQQLMKAISHIPPAHIERLLVAEATNLSEQEFFQTFSEKFRTAWNH